MARRWADHTKNVKKLPEYADQKSPLGRKKKAADAVAPSTAAPATGSAHKMTLLEALLPVLIGGTAGAGYGALASPGKSMARGALVGGAGGALAGTAYSGLNGFLDSTQSRHLDRVEAPLLLGGTAVAGGAGLHLGRQLADRLQLGNKKDKYDDDLTEIDPIQQGGKMLPSALQEYVKRGNQQAVLFVDVLIPKKTAGFSKKENLGPGNLSTAKPAAPKRQQPWTLDVTANKSRITNSNRKPLTMKELAAKPKDSVLSKLSAVLPGLFMKRATGNTPVASPTAATNQRLTPADMAARRTLYGEPFDNQADLRNRARGMSQSALSGANGLDPNTRLSQFSTAQRELQDTPDQVFGDVIGGPGSGKLRVTPQPDPNFSQSTIQPRTQPAGPVPDPAVSTAPPPTEQPVSALSPSNVKPSVPAVQPHTPPTTTLKPEATSLADKLFDSYGKMPELAQWGIPSALAAYAVHRMTQPRQREEEDQPISPQVMQQQPMGNQIQGGPRSIITF